MTISPPRHSPQAVRPRRLPPPVEITPPVFVDDTGRRRVGIRVLWLLVLLAGVVFYASAMVASMLSGAPPEAGTLAPSTDARPYGVLAYGLALNPTIDGTAGCSNVSGETFLDWDLNGAPQLGESGTEIGVEGIEVRAFDAAGAEVATTVTAADGTYNLALPKPMPVRVEFSSPTKGFIESPVGVRSDTSTQFPTLPDCRAELGVVWRHSASAPDARSDRHGVGQVTGWVWNDTDCDGVIDPGETGDSGVPIDLRNPLNGELLAGTSTTGGAYVFAGLQADVRYEVSFPRGTTSTPVAVTTTSLGGTTDPTDKGVSESRMDGSKVQYLAAGDQVVARFSFDEQGQSRHGVNLGLAPAGGCPQTQAPAAAG